MNVLELQLIMLIDIDGWTKRIIKAEGWVSVSSIKFKIPLVTEVDLL